jgi:hypothetical protein
MSRAQQSQTFSTASGESAANETAAQGSEAKDQADIDSQESQLAKSAADNPFVQGGEFQTAENKTLAGAADATATGAAAQNQAQAKRTGENANAGVAAGEEEAQAAQRNLSAAGGEATAARIGSEAGYNKDVLGAEGSIAQQQEQLGALEGGQSQGELQTQEQAALTPSFLDELGRGLADSTGQLANAGIKTAEDAGFGG